MHRPSIAVVRSKSIPPLQKGELIAAALAAGSEAQRATDPALRESLLRDAESYNLEVLRRFPPRTPGVYT